MLLQAKDLIAKTTKQLVRDRSKLSIRPGIALIWVGSDAQTGSFIRVKQQKAKVLDCDFHLHHLESASFDQLAALMKGLSSKKEIHGIVLQLPLPRKEDTEPLIELMAATKDIDHLRPDSPFTAPTPSGILAILEHNGVNLAKEKIVILGNGRLVGSPLSKMLDKKGIRYTQIPRRARDHAEEIRTHDVLISGTGVKNLVTPAMVHKNMVVVDGSGIDVDAKAIEPLVKMITPQRGAIGPLTVTYLFKNLLSAARSQTKS